MQGGVRYTEVDRAFQGCGQDYGDSQFADAFDVFQAVLKGPAGVIPVANGACGTLSTLAFNPSVPAFTPGLVRSELDQNNVSWRTGLNCTPAQRVLLYVTISQGYKSGSFPFLGAAVDSQFASVIQESGLAYEGGFKTTLLDRKLQLNGAGFYYDHSNSQIRGYFDAPMSERLSHLLTFPRCTLLVLNRQQTRGQFLGWPSSRPRQWSSPDRTVRWVRSDCSTRRYGRRETPGYADLAILPCRRVSPQPQLAEPKEPAT